MCCGKKKKLKVLKNNFYNIYAKCNMVFIILIILVKLFIIMNFIGKNKLKKLKILLES